jgi:hypothetical protein
MPHCHIKKEDYFEIDTKCQGPTYDDKWILNIAVVRQVLRAGFLFFRGQHGPAGLRSPSLLRPAGPAP